MSPSSARAAVAWWKSVPATHRLSLFLAVAACGLSSGCVTSQGDNSGELPWATQESWEGTPAIPGGGAGGGSQFGGGL